MDLDEEMQEVGEEKWSSTETMDNDTLRDMQDILYRVEMMLTFSIKSPIKMKVSCLTRSSSQGDTNECMNNYTGMLHNHTSLPTFALMTTTRTARKAFTV